MLYKCKECGQEFEKERGLHTHLRKHEMTVADYYPKHFPRFDKFDGKPIEFKTVSHYFTTDFNSTLNFKKWCYDHRADEAKEYLVVKMRDKIKEKSATRVMGHAHLNSYNWPNVAEIKDIFGSFKAFCEQVGFPAQFGSPIPQDFYKDFSKHEVWVDTREKRPLKFINPTKPMKLDSGDYTVGGDLFSHTFVDRKSAIDFIGTMTRDLDRFKREIQRCCDIGGYMFVVVDATMDGVAKELAFSRSQTNIAHVWHGMREILTEFCGDCQFVFSGNRTNSAWLIPKLLVIGSDLWKVDVQYHIEKDDEWLGK